jgi:hypothetical protein
LKPEDTNNGDDERRERTYKNAHRFAFVPEGNAGGEVCSQILPDSAQC